MKRAHSIFTLNGNDGIDQPGKRPCPPAETGTKQESVNKIYMDALNDISDEIRFAVKCMDRAAGDETGLTFSFS